MMTPKLLQSINRCLSNVIAYLRSVIISKQQNILSLAMKKSMTIDFS